MIRLKKIFVIVWQSTHCLEARPQKYVVYVSIPFPGYQVCGGQMRGIDENDELPQIWQGRVFKVVVRTDGQQQSGRSKAAEKKIGDIKTTKLNQLVQYWYISWFGPLKLPDMFTFSCQRSYVNIQSIKHFLQNSENVTAFTYVVSCYRNDDVYSHYT